jgi:hypothetical protein
MGAFVRDSTWAFPALQSLHFIGMTLLIGVVGVIDLRILGVARELPIAGLRRFLPLAFLGFGINLVTGLMFFSHDPYEYAFNWSFRVKMLLILFAGANALWLRTRAAERHAKLIAALSITLWVGVIAAGRYIAFSAAM